MGYKEDMHQFRTEIDANIQKAADVLKGEQPALDCARRMQIVHNKLSEAKMWVGKCLEAFGSELPKEFQDKAK